MLVEDREIFFENLVRVADATVDDGSLNAKADGRGGHHAAPKCRLLVTRGIPDNHRVGGEFGNHLRAEGHFAGDLHIRRALHGEGESRDRALGAERMQMTRQRLIQQGEFTQHIADRAGIELLEALKQLLDGNRELFCRDALALGDEFLKFHHAYFFFVGFNIGVQVFAHGVWLGLCV